MQDKMSYNKQGEKHGKWVDNKWVDNKRHGYWKITDASGNIWFEGTFIHGENYGYYINVYNEKNTDYEFYAR